MVDTSLRSILARNLQRLIAHDSPHGEQLSARAWAMGRNLDVRLITRLLKADHAVTLDKLDEVAAACGLKPWHLLLEDMDPAQPEAQPITSEERETLRRLRSLLDKA